MNRHRTRVGRHRGWLLGWLVATVAAGLASRRFPSVVPAFLGKYPGDALWALMVFLGAALVLPRTSTGRLALGALAFSFAIEASQLYQAPWINSIRSTTPGHLVLGSAFGLEDLVAYGVGVALGVVGDGFLRRRGSSG